MNFMVYFLGKTIRKIVKKDTVSRVFAIHLYSNFVIFRIEGTADGTPNALLVYLEIMLAAFGFLYIQYFKSVPLYDYLGF
ncbi:MAG: hypothetical protein LBL19_07665, partial [Spirochaetaceae bacterium]|nr:hypothetical protein [Spirochaetaceae bacterium]